MYGWMAFLVMDPGLTAALAVGLASYAGYGLNLSPWGLKALAIATIILVALINIRGVRLGLGNWSNFTPFVAQRTNSAPLLGALAGGLIGAFFSFAGWWDLGKLAGEVRDPARTLPQSTYLRCDYRNCRVYPDQRCFHLPGAAGASYVGRNFRSAGRRGFVWARGWPGVLVRGCSGGAGEPGRSFDFSATSLLCNGS